jgi:tRNA nucleotidyltransferase/poly(A) polymerase
MEQKMTFKQLIETQVFSNIQNAGGEIFFVGGCVRDVMLNRCSKDIDIIVRLLPFEQLQSILRKTGNCELVGESFGVIKYREPGFELDIALPRTDSKGEGKGHKAIDVQSDPMLPLIADLKRRDFTINAMALDMNLNLIDPFNGKIDLESKQLKCVDEEAFVDDPLRILRGVRFSAQLGFSVEKTTHKLMRIHSEKLSEIPAERKLDELTKIAKSGIRANKLMSIIKSAKVVRQLFGVEFKGFTHDIFFSNVAEILTAISHIHFTSIDHKIRFFVERLKIDLETQNFMKGFFHYLELNKIGNVVSMKMARKNLFEALQIAKSIDFLNSELIHAGIKKEFISGTLPLHKHQIALTGQQLMDDFGLKGKEIADMHNKLLDEMFEGTVANNSWELTKFLYKKMAK